MRIAFAGLFFLGYVDGEKYLADDEEYRMQVLENSGLYGGV